MSPFCESGAISSSGFTSWGMEPPPDSSTPNSSSTPNGNSCTLTSSSSLFYKSQLSPESVLRHLPWPAWQLQAVIKPYSWTWDFSCEISLPVAFSLTQMMTAKKSKIVWCLCELWTCYWVQW
jgi:hypothetical protein